jgi:hypothetical protein
VKPFSLLAADRRGDVMFTFGEPSRYTHVLVLRQRLDEPTGPAILLPVDDHIKFEGYLLPGAPECVSLKNHALIATKGQLTFGEKVPESVRAKIRTYFGRLPDFNGRPCKSVLSIRLFARDETVGVLNIESSATDIMGIGAPAVGEVVDTLAPFSLLLACVVRSDERVRSA